MGEGRYAPGGVGDHGTHKGIHVNGKCEDWWAAVEGRLIAMLEGVEALTLNKLNDITVAWVERDYHRRVHRELATTPLARLLDSDDASRPCPDSDALTAAFRITVTRTLRRSDATVSVEGVRSGEGLG